MLTTKDSLAGEPESRDAVLVLPSAEFPDLAPEIVRQRLVVEGLVEHSIGRDEISSYLSGLSEVCDMRILQEPVTHQSPLYGWAGWVHWEASGAHFYAWDQPRKFFSVDIYTCLAFDDQKVLEFTADFFNATRTVARPF